MNKIARAIASAGFAILPATVLAQAGVTADVVIAAANATEAETAEVATVQSGATVNIVSIADLLAGAEATAVNAALTAADDKRGALRSAVAANGYLMAKLGTEGLVTTHVVAVDVAADGTVTIYTKPLF
jgi:hypothetical protein